MKRLLPILVLVAAPFSAFATTFNFTAPTSLNALAHGTAYTWGLDPATLTSLETAIKNGQHITSATITFTNIYDWTVEPGDVLYVDALNGINAGVSQIVYDSTPDSYDATKGPDYFNTASAVHYNYTAGKSDIGNIGSWSDPLGGSAHNNNITLSLTAAQIITLTNDLKTDATTGYATDDVGFGLSPDCHYYDSGVTAQITTAASDGGLALAMFGVGLIALAAYKRKAAAR